ncbi:MAG: integrase arm-type DNA-binding domain-containing protein [Hydrogenophaga sp.]|nr:integrase arm-type DNA-binding domain-containing protein [Hydrogenophaga sp.]MDP3812897.1 integrase arm-type DNA-binding domain-containing protein [Hydrogenophaga sp.]
MPKIARVLKDLEVRNLSAPGLHPVGGIGAQGLALQIAVSRANPEQLTRAWVLRVMVGGKRRDIGLGGFPEVALASAREKARVAREQIKQGIDPVRERQRQRSDAKAAKGRALTFKTAATLFMDEKSAGWRNAKHVAQWRTTLSEYAYPVLAGIQVEDIQLAHVTQVLRPIWITKTETAQRLRGRIEAVLSWATVHGHRTGENPAKWRGKLDQVFPAPRKVAKTKHYAAVPLDAAAGFLSALRSKGGTGARALEFLMLTAGRSGEVRGATWSEIDLNACVWTVAAERMKAGREHRVPLSAPALALLKGLSQDEGQSLVFPSYTGLQMSDVTLTKVMRDLGYTETVHGWRSTFRDWAAERTNYPSDMAEMALAHTLSNKVEAAYRRGDMLEKRRAMMDEWAKFLTVQGTASARVVPLRRKVTV